MTSAAAAPSLLRSGSSSFPGPGSFAPDSSASTPRATPAPPSRNDAASHPTIYTAVYSGVTVYEMSANNVAVMRRKHDSWLNATQILKVAGIEKGKRMKVLEKEILNGVHEKVQGGYGKYQGTWIAYERGVQFCKEYGVYDQLAPLLNLEINTGDKPDTTTPTKEQAMAAKRKRMYNQANGSSGPLFPSISSTVTNAFAALNKSRIESPAPRQPPFRTTSALSNVSMRTEPDTVPPSIPSEQSINFGQLDSAYASQAFPESQPDNEERPLKRTRASPTEQNLSTARPHPDTEPQSRGPIPPVELSRIPNAEHVRQILMNLFVEGNEYDRTLSPELYNLSPEEIDVPMDPNHNAAIHWAASLAKVSLLKTLIERGASIFRVNDAGETALVRGCFVTNNYTQSSFPALLELLYPTIPIADKTGRTILHHIAVRSGMKGRSADSRYYLECLLEFVVKRGAANKSNEMSLARFISEVVNTQDEHGDTALNIAARIGNKFIIQQLLDIGADSKIPNRAGLRPIDFGIGGEPIPTTKEQAWVIPQAVEQKSRDILDSVQETLSSLDKDFRDEIEQKQLQHNAAISQLQNATRRHKEEEQKLESLRKSVNEHAQTKQNCQNLRRALEEERAIFLAKGLDKKEKPDVSALPEPDNSYKIPEAVIEIEGKPTKGQLELLKSLPAASILQARITAYRTNSEQLQRTTNTLHDRSTDLEDRFRRVVALCTGVHKDQVDHLLDKLLQAVESDPTEVDTTKISSFLRKVDESIRCP